MRSIIAAMLDYGEVSVNLKMVGPRWPVLLRANLSDLNLMIHLGLPDQTATFAGYTWVH